MAQDKSDKPKQPKITASDIPRSLSDVRGTGGYASGLPHYQSGLRPPEWREWKHVPVWALHEACALSMNIDPHSLRYPDHRHPSEPAIYDAEVKREFSLRLHVLEANWEARFFKPCGLLESVYSSDFARWAVSVVKWPNLPPELVAMAKAPDRQADAPAEPNPVEANDSRQGAPVDVESDIEATLAALFDPVPVAALEKMFPAGGAWENWAERASRNGLLVAREGRGTFNPYRAAVWFLKKNVPGWDWARCRRTLANNLPPRSQDDAHLLSPDEPS